MLPFYQLPDDPAATRALGFALGQELKPGDLVTLSGPLGAGKTTLVQGLAQALGVTEPVVSPTFVIATEYASTPPLVHIDAYRLEGAQIGALRDAGLEELLGRRDVVALVEWPEMITPWLRPARFALTIAIPPEGGRHIHCVPGPAAP